jgi:hypothetical protein
MDEINDDQKIILIEREHNLGNIAIENDKEQKTNNNNEIDSIMNRDPFEKLKLIKEKIKDENTRIKEINEQLDKISNNNNKLSKKNHIPYKDDYYTENNNNNNKKKSNLQYPNIPVASSQQINTSINGLTGNPTINSIYQKMQNLRQIKVERINPNKSINDIDNKVNIIDKRNNSYIKKNKTNANNIDSRVLFLEEEVKKEKEEKKKIYEKKVQLFRERELEREKQRKKMIEQINNISLSQKNKYSPKKNYITSEEKEEIRKMKEESLYRIENEKRKVRYQPISSEELNNFSNEVKKNEKILKIELDKKKKQMEELWKERKNLLPKYHSKFMELNIVLDNEAKDELILKQEKLKNKELERANFGKEIIKNFQPKILNDKLKTEREQRIKELKGINRFDDIKELGNKLKQKSIKLVQSQPKNFAMKKKFVKEETVAEKQQKKLTGKPVDFLLECRKQKSKMDNNRLAQSNSAKKVKEWKEMLDCGGSNIVKNVEKIKMQAALMDNKANNINLRMKQESNHVKKEELSQEASNLYINSIQAKLQILNKMLVPEKSYD